MHRIFDEGLLKKMLLRITFLFGQSSILLQHACYHKTFERMNLIYFFSVYVLFSAAQQFLPVNILLEFQDRDLITRQNAWGIE